MGGRFATRDALRTNPMPDPRRTRRSVPLWTAYLAVGAVFLVVHAALETGSMAQNLTYDVVGASAVAVALLGVRSNRPDRRLPWVLMAFGQALFVMGDLAWNWYEIIGEDPFPSVADVLYLGGYPFIAAGLFLLIRRRLGDGDRGGLLDAAILTMAVAILSWTFLMQPQFVGTELDPLSLAISLAYPIADLLLIGVAMGLLTTPGARTTSFRLLGASLVLLLVADQIYAIQVFEGSYVAGGPIDTLYLVAYLLFGASVAHPSMCRLTDPQPVLITWLGPIRMLCLAAAMVTGPLLVTLGPDANSGLVVTALGTAVLSLLVLARLAGLVGLLERDVAQRRALEAKLSYQAFHDPLTGLTNRRRFVQQAEEALARRHRTGSVAALFLDLDDFKTVNDSLGHQAGDDVLVAVGTRIRESLRERDLAARLGGDEFGVLLVDIPDPAFAATVSDRLLAKLDAPIDIAGTKVEVGASIGIAIDNPSMSSVDDLLGEADVAMYQAKALGKGRHQIFSPEALAGAGAAAAPSAAEPDRRPWHVRRRIVPRTDIRPTSLEPEAG